MALSVGLITWRYSDTIKQYALDAVKNNITTKVSFNEHVDFTLLKDFPMVSVEIKDLIIQDSFKTDTLLDVKKAFVQFDIFKIIRNEIVVEGIRLEDGFVRVKRNSASKWNFDVWDKEAASDPSAKTDFSIEVLTLQQIQLVYDDRVIDLNVQFYSERSKLKGRFTDDVTKIAVNLNGFLQELSTAGDKRISELPLSLAASLNINTLKRVYTIELGNVILAGNEMVIDAEWKQTDGITLFDLKLNAEKIEPFVLLPHLWPQMPENIRMLQLKGEADLNLTLNGPFTKTQGPQLNATVSMSNGGLLFQEVNVSDLNFNGTLFMQDIKRSKAMQIKFDSFDLKTPQGTVSGKAVLTDLSQPKLRLNCTGASRLEEVIAVAGIANEMQGSGNISWTIVFEGPLGTDFHTTVNELKQMNWSGTVLLDDVDVKFNGGIPQIQDLKTTVNMRSGKTSITKCSGQIGHLMFDGEMDVARLRELLSEPDTKVELTGSIHFGELDIRKLPEEWQFSKTGNDKESAPRQVSINVSTSIDKVIYNDFSATEVAGKMTVNNQELIVTGLTFNALDGKISSELNYSPVGTGSVLRINAKLRNIDMSRALAEWNNFGQKTITSKNLKGRASAILNAEIPLDKDNQVIRDGLKVLTDVEVTGGELIQFEPLLALSKFISVEELNNVRFDTLRNQISISDSRLTIPRMMVSSNILNVEVFGQHGFDQEMDYHVNLLLNDLLRRKAKRQETFDGHEIIDERGRTRLFLWVRGKPGDIKIGFDKKEVRKKLKDDLKEEGKSLKQLFKEEFGGGTSTTKEENAVQFRLEEETDQKPTDVAPSEKAGTKDKSKKKKGLLTKEPETDETEGGFEIEFEP